MLPDGTASPTLGEVLERGKEYLVIIAAARTPAEVDAILGLKLPNVIGQNCANIRFNDKPYDLITNDQLQTLQKKMTDALPEHYHPLIMYSDAGFHIRIPDGNPPEFHKLLHQTTTDVEADVGFTIGFHTANAKGVHFINVPAGSVRYAIERFLYEFSLDWPQKPLWSYAIVDEQGGPLGITSAVTRALGVKPLAGLPHHVTGPDKVISILHWLSKAKATRKASAAAPRIRRRTD